MFEAQGLPSRRWQFHREDQPYRVSGSFEITVPGVERSSSDNEGHRQSEQGRGSMKTAVWLVPKEPRGRVAERKGKKVKGKEPCLGERHK